MRRLGLPKRSMPEFCPKCKSNTSIMGRTMVVGMADINLVDMTIDEHSDDFEILDRENMRYRCYGCDFEWGCE